MGIFGSAAGCRSCSEGSKLSVWKKLDDSESNDLAEAPALPTATKELEEIAKTPDEPAEKGEFKFDFQPKTLRVYRATKITLWVTQFPYGERPSSVEWRFDDEITVLKGQEVKYNFEGGLRDRSVTATLTFPSGKTIRATRSIPLEKIPVGETEKEVKAKPVPVLGDIRDGLRVVYAGNIRNKPDLADEVKKILSLEPHILFVLGNFGASGKKEADQWSFLRTGLVEPAQKQGVWVLPVLGNEDLRKGRRKELTLFWQQHKPAVDLLPDSLFPESYTFRRDGVFFASVWTGHRSSDAEIIRLQSVLGRGQGDPSRIVVSHFPLAPLTEKDDGHLEKAYRFYEVMERHGVAAHVSGHYGVSYLGQYGGLKSFSSGRVNGDCDLLPSGQCTPPAVLVMDFSRGKLERVFVVDLGEPLSLYPTKNLPAVLFNYRRWDPKNR